jgi:hypothetical protein
MTRSPARVTAVTLADAWRPDLQHSSFADKARRGQFSQPYAQLRLDGLGEVGDVFDLRHAHLATITSRSDPFPKRTSSEKEESRP